MALKDAMSLGPVTVTQENCQDVIKSKVLGGYNGKCFHLRKDLTLEEKML